MDVREKKVDTIIPDCLRDLSSYLGGKLRLRSHGNKILIHMNGEKWSNRLGCEETHGPKDDLDFCINNYDVENHEKLLFRLYSMTKPLVATLFMIFVQEGKVSLDTPLEEILPEFKNLKVQSILPAEHRVKPKQNTKRILSEIYSAAKYLIREKAGDFFVVKDSEIVTLMKQHIGFVTHVAMTYGFDVKCNPDSFGFSISQQETELPSAEKKITMRHLLSHTSGIGYGPAIDYGPPSSGVHWKYENLVRRLEKDKTVDETTWIGSIREWVESLAKIPLLFQPGTKRLYGYNLDLMGYVCEVLGGESLDMLLEKRIFSVLNMNKTKWFLTPDENKDCLLPLWIGGRKGKGAAQIMPDGWKYGNHDCPNNLRGSPVLAGGGGNGLLCGGIVAPLEDYMKFGKALLYGESKLLSSQLMHELTQVNQLPIVSEKKLETMKPGLGVSLIGFLGLEELGPWLKNSFGWSGMAGTSFAAYPEMRAIIVYGIQKVDLSPPRRAIQVCLGRLVNAEEGSMTTKLEKKKGDGKVENPPGKIVDEMDVLEGEESHEESDS